MGSSHTLDQLDTCFDDTHAIANAGLLLPATLAERLGIEQTADALIDRPPSTPAGAEHLIPNVTTRAWCSRFGLTERLLILPVRATACR